MKKLELINPEIFKNWSSFASQYQNAEPFHHVALDNFLKEDVAAELASSFPSFNDPIWYEYNNPIEKKLASDDVRKFPPLFAKVIHSLNSEPFLKKVEELTDIKDLNSDPYLHGGGLHCTKKEGKLDIHLDYSIHPKLKMERRVNLILYLSPEWSESWGGHLELWNKDISKCEQKLMPKFNRAALFSTHDFSFHGHPDPLNCPENLSRNSIALYYLTEPRKESSPRPRARFFARPFDPFNKELEDFRVKRSVVSDLYKKNGQ